jgi:hypothetical protein
MEIIFYMLITGSALYITKAIIRRKDKKNERSKDPAA